MRKVYTDLELIKSNQKDQSSTLAVVLRNTVTASKEAEKSIAEELHLPLQSPASLDIANAALVDNLSKRTRLVRIFF